MKARTVDTIRGRYAIKESNGTAIAVSMIDDQDIFEFDVPADELTDDEEDITQGNDGPTPDPNEGGGENEE